MGSQTHQLLQLFLLLTTNMVKVARESMTSDALQTSLMACQQEDESFVTN